MNLKLSSIFSFAFIVISFCSLANETDTLEKPAIANYEIKVRLDDELKTLNGEMKLVWHNLSADTINELQFHTYLNAFKNASSTFMQEKGINTLKAFYDLEKKEFWGKIDVKSIKVIAGDYLTNNISYIQPDDDNSNDQTVMQVKLIEPLMPGETIKLNLRFIAKLPRIIARTGYEDDFFMVGQWYPKIGVYESKKKLKANQGAWNCHQYHYNTEFYSNFGNYKVQIILPNKYAVGATGELKNVKSNGNGTKALEFHANHVIDFAWAASPRFILVDGKWKDVTIRLLVQPEHQPQANRYVKAAVAALNYMEKNLAPFPYSTLTIIDPPFRAYQAGGMEYPMLITTGTIANMPEGIRYPESVTIHELVHQYFMATVANNEFEEPWLDEGITSYYEAKIMDSNYGSQTSLVNLFNLNIGNLEYQRSGYTLKPNPYMASNTLKVWEFNNEDYFVVNYNKTAIWLATLEGYIGQKTMNNIMKTYYNTWRYKHPTGQDFIDIVSIKVKEEHGEKFGENMNWFFEQMLYTNKTCDYELEKILNFELPYAQQQDPKANKKDKKYYSKVIVKRLGDIIMPVDVKVDFADGSSVIEKWDGKKEKHEFIYENSPQLLKATIDPAKKLLIDVNLKNNSLVEKKDYKPFVKYFIKALFWLQNLLYSFSMII